RCNSHTSRSRSPPYLPRREEAHPTEAAAEIRARLVLRPELKPAAYSPANDRTRSRRQSRSRPCTTHGQSEVWLSYWALYVASPLCGVQTKRMILFASTVSLAPVPSSCRPSPQFCAIYFERP